LLLWLVERGHSGVGVVRHAEDVAARKMLPEPPAGRPSVISLSRAPAWSFYRSGLAQ